MVVRGIQITSRAKFVKFYPTIDTYIPRAVYITAYLASRYHKAAPLDTTTLSGMNGASILEMIYTLSSLSRYY